MSATPSSRDWVAIVVTLSAAFTAFMTAYSAFNAPSAALLRRVNNMAIILCATEDPRRRMMCDQLGVIE